MTNHWIDIKNADVVLIFGSNAAENHPVSFRWVTEAMEKGAKLISVDPRFTRTSSAAHIYAPLRSGTDIAFIGGMINYVIQNNRYHEDYIVNYTNAAAIVNAEFKDPGELDGLFVGYDENKRSYDTSKWQYQLEPESPAPEGAASKPIRFPQEDRTLQNPNCVFQIVKKHYSRYDPDTVSKITGTPKDVFLRVCELYASTGEPGKSGTIMYAMGQTQHTVGTQNVRALAILQLLLGNIGVAGGGVNALRGLFNVQGSTDMSLLSNMLPGYLSLPDQTRHPTLKDYVAKETPVTSYWNNRPNFFVSLLKAWWGNAASKENDFAFDYLPKSNGNYSWIPLFEAMYAGKIKGLLVLGQNPAVSGADLPVVREALGKLDWMVVSDLWETETASFWKRPGVKPADINTEVFLLPAAASFERSGSITNSGRWIMWRWKAIDPLGDAKPDLWMLDQVYKAIRKAYEGSRAARDKPILDLNWNYGDDPDYETVAKEVNGYDLNTGKLVAGFAALKADGTTSCGNWIYSGFYPADSTNKAAGRDNRDPSGLGFYQGWGFAWPANRRILYNRCSTQPDGTPWNPNKRVIWWDANEKKWVGNDVPDFAPRKAPDAKRNPTAVGLASLGGTDAFIMKTDGKGWTFAPSGVVDGPLPEHYEPLESPTGNILSRTNFNPASKIWRPEEVGKFDKYPIVGTTYRLSEHMQAGGMSRNLPWLAELMPELFVEMGRALAKEKDIANGDRVIINTARGQVKAIALVTDRFRPFNVDGKTIHQIGVPWHFGYAGIIVGDSANLLTPHVGDANTMMPEYKAFLCDVQKA